MRRWRLGLAALAVLLVLPAAAWAVGELAQKGGTAGCVSETGTAGACQNGKALDEAQNLTVSADGKSVYVASASGGVAILDRNTTTGALTQKTSTAGCVSDNGSGANCQNGTALDSPIGVAASADGKSAYVGSFGSDAVGIFDRNPTTGALTQKLLTAGCLAEDGTGTGCDDGRALDGASGVAISPDGKSVYVASVISDAVAILKRDTTSGALTQSATTAGCVAEGGGDGCQNEAGLTGPSGVALSPDGKSVYVASAVSDAVAVFDRDTTTGTLSQSETTPCVAEIGGDCVDGKALDGAYAVAVSRDGKSVYVASENSDAVAILDRNTTTGALTQKAGTAGCVSETGSGGACQNGKALNQPLGVAVSADGRSAYVGASTSGAVAIFDRNATTGALSQKAGTAGCVSETGGGGACQDGKALDDALGVAVSPNSKSAYVAAAGSNAVAILDRNTSTGGGGGGGGSTPTALAELVPGLRVCIASGLGRCDGFGVGTGRTTAIRRGAKFGAWSIGNGRAAPRRTRLRVPAKQRDCRSELNVVLTRKSFGRVMRLSRQLKRLFNDRKPRRPKVVTSRKRRKLTGVLILARRQVTVSADGTKKVRLKATKKGRKLLKAAFRKRLKRRFKGTLRVYTVCNGLDGMATGRKTVRFKLKLPKKKR